MANRFDVYTRVADEMNRQREKWGVQRHHDERWLTILGEEFGEASKAILEDGDLDAELIQIAAVAISWLESRELFGDLR